MAQESSALLVITMSKEVALAMDLGCLVGGTLECAQVQQCPHWIGMAIINNS